MVILYGVNHYGKENYHIEYGECQQCGQTGQLSSYDTAQFFTLFFIPLIPLGKKRIIDQCPNCKKHYEIRLSKYYKQKEEDLHDINNKIQQGEEIEKNTINLIHILFQYAQFDEYLRLSDVLAAKSHSNTDILNLLAVKCYQLGSYEKSIRYANQSYQINQNSDAISILSSASAGLAQKLYEKGKYPDGLKHLRDLIILDPEKADDQEIKSLIEIGEKSQPVADQLTPVIEYRKKGTPTILPTLIPAGLLLALAVFIGSIFVYDTFFYEVWLVNGLKEAYSVTINKKEYQLPESGQIRIVVNQDVLNFSEDSDLIHITENQIDLKKGEDSDAVFIINPDQQAMIIKEKTIYSMNPEAGIDNPYEFFIGDFTYQIDDIDYFFEEFPETIKLSSSLDEEIKHRVYHHIASDSQEILEILIYHGDREKIAKYLDKYLPFHRADNYALSVYISQYAGDRNESEIRSFLEKYLYQEPVSIEWHRSYQEFMSRAFPEVDIYQHYLQNYQQNSQNPMYAYLLGRIEEDEDKAFQYYQLSENGSEPIGYGYHAIAYHYMCKGDFQNGYSYAVKAYETDNKSFFSTYYVMSEAMNKIDPILKDYEERWLLDQSHYSNTYNYLYYLWLADNEEKAQEVQDTYLINAYEEDIPIAQAYFQALYHYLNGNLNQCKEALSGLDEYNSDPYLLAILNKDVEALQEQIGDWGNLENYCVLYILSKNQKAGDIAKYAYDKIMELLQDGEKEEQKLYQMLVQKKGVNFSEFVDLNLVPELKRVIATMVGLAYPGAKKQFFAYANQLNQFKSTPYWLIKETTSD
ncbi:MAG: zinc ribbon domain-containing protein [Spirochaetes bacterium]|nr:zinc ribbon domain-containing protein [Spirochaetota bacterium]